MTNNNQNISINIFTKNLILSEMILGIGFYGVICQLVIIGVILFGKTDRVLYYSGGLWIGIIVAALMAVHMNYSISKALDFDESTAIKLSKKDAIIRYIASLFVFGVLMVTNILSPIVAFIGVMGLKIGAYMQPVTHKILRRIGPFGIKAYIEADDINRAKMLEEYYEEQERLKEEAIKEKAKQDLEN